MPRSNSRPRARALRTGIALAAVVATTLAIGPAQSALGVGAILPGTAGGDADRRAAGVVAPTAAQLDRVRALSATARWNRYGTPQTLLRRGGYLASGLSSDPAAAARAFVRANRGLFKLSDAAVTGLDLVNSSRLTASNGYAVLFRQKFGSVPAAEDGLISLGVNGGKIAFVSSSSIGDAAAPVAASQSPNSAWLKAAAEVGRVVPASSITNIRAENDWTTFSVTGFAQRQQARLRALPVRAGAVRPVYEVNVVDVQGGAALAYTSFVDAVSGAVLLRRNQVDQLAPTANQFSGAFKPTACGPKHAFTVPRGTKQITASAFATVTTNDIIVKILDSSGTVLVASDTATSPEAATYSPATGVPAGKYFVQVCPFATPTVPFVRPYTYTGVFTTSDQAPPPGGVPYPPKWEYFQNTPELDGEDADTRKVGCWESMLQGNPVPGCNFPLRNLAARAPWDYNTRTNTPTFTTSGNAAQTAEAWTSPLTPGAAGQRPTSPTREYRYPWTDQWQNAKCDPTVFATPQRNDIDAAVTNLFAQHNRMHDWSYFLGFTEQNYNLQENNFGNPAQGGTVPGGGEGDPEIGNVQAGAVDGGFPTYRGRDNANQITLQDGIPGITNQYLFQPVAGGFYSPCVDGDFDMTVIGHEYTHAISSRMVGGPDGGLSSEQGGAMGESWSDLVAIEYLMEYGYVPVDGEDPFAVGAYVTGNKKTGIRNYSMADSPLNYSNYGYDFTGPQVHASGEIWSAVNYDIRRDMINKYNGAYPASNRTLQKDCADGKRQPQLCPGNRRWVQLMFDAFLLQTSGTGMLDARDAMLAADVMRFDGANQALLWKAFARRGFGVDADSTSGDDTSPRPGWIDPVGPEGTVNLIVEGFPSRTKVASTIYVGRYEARSRPLATTKAGQGTASVKLVPGTYDLVVRSPGYGLTRSSVTVTANSTTTRAVHLALNLASMKNGATAAGDGGNFEDLIDDTESTNYAILQATPSVVGKSVTVDLAGGRQWVRNVKVSSMLRAAMAGDDYDAAGQNRFTALRQFAIETCTQSTTSSCAADQPSAAAGFSRIYISPPDAFPSGRPRPLAPQAVFRSFDVDDTEATHVRLVVLNNHCTGGPAYQGEQDNDPANVTDCGDGSRADQEVRIAELEVFSSDSSTRPPGDPVVATTMTAPTTATEGSTFRYTLGYTNLGPEPSASAKITDVLPAGVTFVSASDGGTYNAAARTVTWNLGTVPLNFTGSRTLTVKVNSGLPAATLLVNTSQYTAALTLAPPAAATTLVP